MEKKKLTIEEAFVSLDEIVEQLESSDASLEEAFTLYQKGMKLLKDCSSRIDRVEKKMLKVNEDGEMSEF